ncbi:MULTISPECIES: hypothetical protein [Anaerolinea]|uniref:hypothetical protein n=1 Tax=Anaerolinea TaxID=233189 RepID=UPI00261C99F9|nr:hypothetical protein [Anaerolinea thermophila]
MSGHKRTTVTISQEEYRKLYEAEMLLKGLDLQSSGKSGRPSVEAITFLNTQMDYSIQRQEQFLRLGEALRNEVSSLENSTAENIRDLEYHLLQEIQQNNENVFETMGKFEEDLKRLENHFVKANEDTLKILWQFQHQSNEFLYREEEKGEYVRGWLDDCIQVFNFILENYPESVPYIENLQNVQTQLDFAIQNFHLGFYDSALNLSQTIYFNLSSLRLKLENEGVEKRRILAEIIDELSKLQNNLRRNRKIKPVDLQGNLIDSYISVDEWSGNTLSQLESYVSQLIQEFNKYGIQQSLEILRDFKENQLQSLKNQLIEVIHQARLNALNAHLNYLIAHDVLLALVEQGYKPIEGEYESEEIKDTYIAKAVDPLGNLVEIQVQTTSPEKIEHDLHIISTHKQNHSLHELRQRAKEIQKSLNKIGWVVQDPIELPNSITRTVKRPSQVRLPLIRGDHA